MRARGLLKLLLLTLAAAAFTGIIAIFAAPSVTGRAALTACAAALCIALAIPVSRLLDKDSSRPGGMVGLSAIVLAMVVFFAAIWGGLIISWWAEARLAGTGFLVLFGGVVPGFLLTAWNKTGYSWAARVAVVAGMLGAVVGIAAVWTGSHPLDENLGISAMHIAGAGAAAAMCLVGAGRAGPLWPWIGVLSALVQFSLGIYGTWFDRSGDPTLFTAMASVSFVIGHANVMKRVPAGQAGFWAKLAAIIGMAGAGISTTIVVLVDQWYDSSGSDIPTRILGASALMATCGTMAVLILYRLQKKSAGAIAGPLSSAITKVDLTCPHCGKGQAIEVAPRTGHCSNCNLVIRVTIREPRCTACEYPLLGVKGDRCPECGEPIASSFNEKPPDVSGGS